MIWLDGERTWAAWRRRALLIFCTLLLIAPLSGNPVAGEQEERRIQVGVKLFPSLLAADRDIAGKRDGDGPLRLLLLYRDRREVAERAAERLREVEKVRGIPIAVEVVPLTGLAGRAKEPFAGMFITQRLGEHLDEVIAVGRERQVVLFSPFEQDVERGVLGGVLVSDRILPQVNVRAMQEAGIRLKSFFLRIADRYEP
ncbi:hypothetical protein [Endothiovibrio diazotrophicus]